MPVPNVKNDDRQNALSFTNSNQFFPNNVTSWYFGNFFCDFILQRVEALCRWVWFWKSIPRDERSLLWIRLKWHAAVSAFVSLSCTETHRHIHIQYQDGDVKNSCFHAISQTFDHKNFLKRPVGGNWQIFVTVKQISMKHTNDIDYFVHSLGNLVEAVVKIRLLLIHVSWVSAPIGFRLCRLPNAHQFPRDCPDQKEI